MKTKLTLILGLLTAALGLPAFAQGTAFTYQGRLDDGANPASGTYDLRFALFDAGGGGVPHGAPLTNANVSVSNGLFTVTLDFGNQFPGAGRWLEIGVRTNGGGAFTTLSPRQGITPTPYAVQALTVSSNALASYGAAVSLANPANAFTGTFSGDGSSLSNVNVTSLGGLTASNLWQLGGNAATTPGVNFLGTTDNQPLELKVKGTRALRLEPTTNSVTVNVIGGSPYNAVGAGVRGATIGGGGGFYGIPSTNRVDADFGTIAGGMQNTIHAEASLATIGGGDFNTIHAGAYLATIGGGEFNTIHSDAQYATLGGGRYNIIESQSASVTISGGSDNRIEATQYSTIGGGNGNLIPELLT